MRDGPPEGQSPGRGDSPAGQNPVPLRAAGRGRTQHCPCRTARAPGFRQPGPCPALPFPGGSGRVAVPSPLHWAAGRGPGGDAACGPGRLREGSAQSGPGHRRGPASPRASAPPARQGLHLRGAPSACRAPGALPCVAPFPPPRCRVAHRRAPGALGAGARGRSLRCFITLEPRALLCWSHEQRHL